MGAAKYVPEDKFSTTKIVNTRKKKKTPLSSISPNIHTKEALSKL